MKKLSKVLAFALAFAMTLSMGSFAATFVNNEFSDIEQATNPDAISQLAALDVMNGYTDGTIRPQGDITRAEIAKMIYVIKMGGKDDGAAYYKSVKTNLTDIEGHWAEGYIKYCFSTGIIAGRDDNKFYPDDNVTGVELAKMLLVVQGYNAQKSGLVGAGWSNNVVELGAENNYFKGYNTLLNNAATREGAASIIVNSLDAEIVTWSDDAGDYIKLATNNDTKTIGARYFDLHTYEGVLLSTGKYAIDLVRDKATGGSTLAGTSAVGKISINKVKTDDEAEKEMKNGTREQFTFDEDASELVGQYVRVSVGKSGKVYGIYAMSDKNTVIDTTVDKVVAVYSNGKPDHKIEIDGKSYKLDTNYTAVYNDQDGQPVPAYAGAPAGAVGIEAYFQKDETYDASKVRFIDNDGDGRIDIALVNPILGVRKVTATTSTSFSAGEKVNYDEVITSQKFNKGDWVVKTTNFFEGKAQYDLATVVEGKVTSYADETRNNLAAGAANKDVALPSVEIDDEKWYTSFDKARIETLNDDTFTTTSFSSEGSINIAKTSAVGSTRRLVTVGDVLYYDEVITNGASDIAFVTEGGAAQTASVSKMKLMFADGSTATVNCTLATKPGSEVTTKLDAAKAAASTTGKLTASEYSDFMDDAFSGRLVSYEINDDGEYELTLMESSTVADAGYGAAIEVKKYESNKNRVYDASDVGYVVDNNATVFVQYKDGEKDKYTVIKGSELLDFSKAFGTSGWILTEKGGVKSATVILLISNQDMPGSQINKGLAVISKNATTTTKIGSTTYHKVTAWTLDGEKTLYISDSNFKDDSGNPLQLGSAFTYNLDESNSNYAIAKDVETLENFGAIYYIDGNKSVAVSATGEIAADPSAALTATQLTAYEVSAALDKFVSDVAALTTKTKAEVNKLITAYNATKLSDGTTIGDSASYKIAALDTTTEFVSEAEDDDTKTTFAEWLVDATNADGHKKVVDALITTLKTDAGDAIATEDAASVTTAAQVNAKLQTVIDTATSALTRTYKLASDVKVLNIETKTNKITGIEDDSISEAKEQDNVLSGGEKVYYQNAYYLLDGDPADPKDDPEINYIVIDVNGEWNLN